MALSQKLINGNNVFLLFLFMHDLEMLIQSASELQEKIP
jgi:hypothetical protein